jgi:hypothetical protein
MLTRWHLNWLLMKRAAGARLRIQAIVEIYIDSGMAFHMQGIKDKRCARWAGATRSRMLSWTKDQLTPSREQIYEERTMRLYSRFILAVILSAAIGVNAQDVASDTSKAAKDTGHATAKAAQATEHGTEKAVEKTSSATGHAVKKTAHGIKKGVKGTGRELKGDESKPETPK